MSETSKTFLNLSHWFSTALPTERGAVIQASERKALSYFSRFISLNPLTGFIIPQGARSSSKEAPLSSEEAHVFPYWAFVFAVLPARQFEIAALKIGLKYQK